MDRWAGRVAVVTGASSGIGEAIAKELTKHGMKVAALARRTDKLKNLEKECESYKGLMKTYKCDVSLEKEISSTVEKIVQDLGPISVLVNNAGVSSFAPITDTNDQEKTRKIFETNVIGLIAFINHTTEIMQKHNINDGHIININSVLGHRILPTTGVSSYTASKHAVTVITESLKNELAILKSKTRVTSISPGFVETEMTAKFAERIPKEYPRLQTNDIVQCVTFVLQLPQNTCVSEITVEPTGEIFGQLKPPSKR